MSNRINQSWREQRKAVIATDTATAKQTEYISVWQAAIHISQEKQCLMATARKEIRKAIVTGHQRYGFVWRWKETEQ